MNKPRYRLQVTDLNSGVTRTWEAQVVMESKDSRMFLGQARVEDLRIDARYVKQLCVRKRPKMVQHPEAVVQ